MRAFVIILCVATCYGRPEAGYNYAIPNRGFNSGSTVVTASNQIGATGGGVGAGSGVNFGVTNSGGYASNFGGGGVATNFNGGSYSGGATGGISSTVTGFGAGGGNAYNTNTNAGFGFGNNGEQQTLIQKHIYVHVPPPEPEELRQQQQINVGGVAQKHYKIIFIKAPSPPSPSAIQLAQAAQANQEKTIVYVLVKKPDDIGDINVQQAIAPPPSKPEVYFIKYKTHKENGGAIGSGNGGIGVSTTNIGNAIGSGQLSGGSQFIGTPILTGSADSSAVIAGPPAQAYGPPGQSGPY